MSARDRDIMFEYPDDAMRIWEALWGKDFISPGGAEETRFIVSGVDLKGKSVLEVGSGWGGPSLLFAKECGAAKVVGIDLQAKAVEKASLRAAELGLQDIVEFKTVNSLNWPFPDGAFDIVFSKDALLHTPDKETLYAEMARVLKPGGQVVYADSFGTDLPATPEMQKWMKDNSHFCISLGSTVDIFIRLGFRSIRVEDRCERFEQMIQEDSEKLRGDVGKELASVYGAERLQELQATWFDPCAVLKQQGQLRLGNFFATKPACKPFQAAGGEVPRRGWRSILNRPNSIETVLDSGMHYSEASCRVPSCRPEGKHCGPQAGDVLH
eukprot:CAMPEP_0204602736 /NCGR_PEP_ID=MMETSP0661-20131031/56836_1 /ASSEMBLY_ACC=CAM_ASM_000606 /TAXON_ID=109239 /ORGANISM="Alexandrium margalefi, Strain AMGDE01CS-322" /LENGTH=324 /DNA_ID=CAMNT_0051613735 /DNA_START=95 /DNA_END=1070 /DNA_ORIENTATION=-